MTKRIYHTLSTLLRGCGILSLHWMTPAESQLFARLIAQAPDMLAEREWFQEHGESSGTAFILTTNKI